MKILYILSSTEHLPLLQQYIASVDRLDELVKIQTTHPTPAQAVKMLCLAVHNNQISPMLDWQNLMMPYIFPQQIALNENHFLGMIFGLLGNFDKAYRYLAETPLWQEWDYYLRLYSNQPVAVEALEKKLEQTEDPLECYRAYHNIAFIYYYAYLYEPESLLRIEYYFLKALKAAPHTVARLFSTKQYANFLADIGQVEKANSLLAEAKSLAQDNLIQAALGFVWVQVMMKKLAVPYDANLLQQLKNTLWDTLQFYEKNQCKAESALLLMDASMIANIENSFAESLGYVNKAIQLFKEEELAQLIGEACLRKGILLYTWSKNGQPQFYRPALEAFQEALKYFDKENAPDVFADIHHHLGIVYAEMPDENKKRSIWAALSASSFKEALEFFNKQDYPYEYAVVANNYANAMTLYPQMKKADNFAKALELYDEALSIRNPDQYPYERALTLMNYLEASWQVSNAEEGFNEERFQDMVSKALEIKVLVDDVQLKDEADKHLEALEKLKTSFQQNA
ncbi:MAG TPA: hypothetical protein DCM08_10510 [Microscillaceae bacterium]|nr:hypothetical protein [Microscillaceae bacterium]